MTWSDSTNISNKSIDTTGIIESIMKRGGDDKINYSSGITIGMVKRMQEQNEDFELKSETNEDSDQVTMAIDRDVLYVPGFVVGD